MESKSEIAILRALSEIAAKLDRLLEGRRSQHGAAPSTAAPSEAVELAASGVCLGCKEPSDSMVRGNCSACYAATMRAIRGADDPGAMERRLVAAGLLLPAGKPGRRRKVNLLDRLAQAEADTAKAVRADTPALDEAMRNRDDAAVERELANEALRDSATKTPRRKSRRK